MRGLELQRTALLHRKLRAGPRHSRYPSNLQIADSPADRRKLPKCWSAESGRPLLWPAPTRYESPAPRPLASGWEIEDSQADLPATPDGPPRQRVLPRESLC